MGATAYPIGRPGGAEDCLVIGLFDFEPRHCPGCGEPLSHNGLDWTAKASHSCGSCGFMYQLAETADLTKAATASGGDLERYA